MSKQSDGRWWEFYGIRYAQGTVVGAMLVFFLFSQNKSLDVLLFIPKEPKDFGLAHLLLLGVYGLAYCYIASAPILIMHAGRGLLFKSPTNPNPNENLCSIVLSLLLVPIVFSGLFYCYLSKNVLDVLAFLLYILTINYECKILIQILYTSWSQTISYYNVIVSKRNSPENFEFTESYKHIREHGNSFLIVWYEFLLAVPIYQFVSKSNISQGQSILNLTLIIIIWILPASLIWCFGNKLENQLNFMK